MQRIIQTVTKAYQRPALDFVERVFTEHADAAEGRAVRRIVEEIRAKKYYLPDLELMTADENGEIIGYAMFSRFHIEGRYEDELLLLSPVAVKTELQRRHISKELLEYGMDMARWLGYRAVLVEGDPRNYHARGFVTAADHGIVPGPNIHLPHIDCLMVAELVPGALERIHGTVDYGFYDTLREEQKGDQT